LIGPEFTASANLVGDDGNAPRGNFPTYYADGFTDRCQGHHPMYEINLVDRRGVEPLLQE